MSRKVVQNFQPKYPNEKCEYHSQLFTVILELWSGQTCLGLFGKLSFFFEQMVAGQYERNFPLGIFVYHFHKPL